MSNNIPLLSIRNHRHHGNNELDLLADTIDNGRNYHGIHREEERGETVWGTGKRGEGSREVDSIKSPGIATFDTKAAITPSQIKNNMLHCSGSQSEICDCHITFSSSQNQFLLRDGQKTERWKERGVKGLFSHFCLKAKSCFSYLYLYSLFFLWLKMQRFCFDFQLFCSISKTTSLNVAFVQKFCRLAIETVPPAGCMIINWKIYVYFVMFCNSIF